MAKSTKKDEMKILKHDKQLVDHYFNHFCSKSNPAYAKYRSLDKRLTGYYNVQVPSTYYVKFKGNRNYTKVHSNQIIAYGDSYIAVPLLIKYCQKRNAEASRKVGYHIRNNGFNLITIDPPYNLTHVTKKTKEQLNKRAKHYHISLASMTNGFSFKIIPELVQLLYDPSKINMQIFCSEPQKDLLKDYFRNKYNCTSNDFSEVNITKTNSKFANKNLRDNVEYCLWVHRGLTFKNDYPLNGSGYKVSQNECEDKLFKHPTVKWLYIVRNLIACATQPGDKVFDCFAGSFTSAVACKLLGLDGMFIDYNKGCAEEGLKRLVAPRKINKALLNAECFHLKKMQPEATAEKKANYSASKEAKDNLKHNLLFERLNDTLQRLGYDDRLIQKQKREIGK